MASDVEPTEPQPEYPVPKTHIVTTEEDGTLIYYAKPRRLLPCLPPPKNKLVQKRLPPASIPLNSSTLLHDRCASVRGRAVLVICNPSAGRNSLANHRRFLARFRDVLETAGVSVTVRMTDHPGHAKQIVCDEPAFRAFDAIVSAGGDGTLHEITAGLVAKLCEDEPVPPLAILPAGTGNALAVSMGLMSIPLAALNVLHALREPDVAVRPICVLQYRRLSEAGRERVVVGGVQWGFTAEVDQGTENMRMLGDLRFHIGALLRIVSRRDFEARVVVRIHREKHERACRRIAAMRGKARASGLVNSAVFSQIGTHDFVAEERFLMIVAWNCRAVSDGFALTPLADVGEVDAFDVLVVPSGRMTRGQMLAFMQHADGSFLTRLEGFAYFKATRLVFERLEGNFLTVDGESVAVEPFVLEIAPETGAVSMLDSFADPAMAA